VRELRSISFRADGYTPQPFPVGHTFLFQTFSLGSLEGNEYWTQLSSLCCRKIQDFSDEISAIACEVYCVFR